MKNSNKSVKYIPNVEGTMTFIDPFNFIWRNWDALEDNLEKSFLEHQMRNVFAEKKSVQAKLHKCRRAPDCLCTVFLKDILILGHH